MDTTLWEAEADLSIPDNHNNAQPDTYGQIVTRVFTAETAAAAARWVQEEFITQWPKDVIVRSWRLAVFAPYDVDTRTGPGTFTIYDSRYGDVRLDIATFQYDNRP